MLSNPQLAWCYRLKCDLSHQVLLLEHKSENKIWANCNTRTRRAGAINIVTSIREIKRKREKKNWTRRATHRQGVNFQAGLGHTNEVVLQQLARGTTVLHGRPGDRSRKKEWYVGGLFYQCPDGLVMGSRCGLPQRTTAKRAEQKWEGTTYVLGSMASNLSTAKNENRTSHQQQRKQKKGLWVKQKQQ